jgi:hypothetical protein
MLCRYVARALASVYIKLLFCLHHGIVPKQEYEKQSEMYENTHKKKKKKKKEKKKKSVMTSPRY